MCRAGVLGSDALEGPHWSRQCAFEGVYFGDQIETASTTTSALWAVKALICQGRGATICEQQDIRATTGADAVALQVQRRFHCALIRAPHHLHPVPTDNP
ncbi:hypothetical protein AAFF_G00269460 [Aldrovandia affinis]|uniref:Uncharacterized protein n=1 Tax=Aldrovandia affinis TaxID=143900 RepID=A0AAD7STI9_9TELE|nr:hypothetical protein AAFF_G00269460 [Aldrovandia affinis]